jgi:hypothetical protein
MSKVKDPCVYCGNSTAFGFGRFVNRLPVDDGWGCAECSGFACDSCGEQIYLDEEIAHRDNVYHEKCLADIKKRKKGEKK